jgi:glycosyltransferase involved in cell wall biosynthesis
MCTGLSHRVIAVSKETAAHLLELEKAPPDKVVVIHNGIDFERVRLSKPEIQKELRRALALEREFVFLIAGRLHPEKGYEVLFDAVELLKATAGRPFVVLVAGEGPLLEHYKDEVQRRGIADHFRFLGFRRDLPDLMMASDVFTLPSLAESFGLVLAEALFLGRPVLGSRVGGIPEIVDDGVDGVLVPPGDARALADAMSRFLSREVRLPGQGAAAQQKVRDRFDFRSMLRSYEMTYEFLLHRRP